MRWSVSRWVTSMLALAMLAGTSAVAAEELPDADTPAFGEYRLIPLLDDATAYPGPATPTSLDGVHIGEWVAEELSPEALARLAEQGFVVVPSRTRLFHDAYQDLSGGGTPSFVTTDAAYHSWHLVFDKILREVEQKRLLPALEQLVKGMRKNAAAQQRELADTELADDAARVYDLLSTTAAVLGLPDVKLSERAQAEVALIESHGGSEASPILETLTDYSLFTPRGHYTRNEDLERYFVAMSVLGQHSFQLPGARDPNGEVIDKTTGLRRALLASRILVGHPELEDLWTTIFEPTAFLVGVSDDYTPLELADAVETTVPGAWVDPSLAADDETLRAVADALTAERAVRIDPERPSVRLMGTRFVLDSWILDQLVGPNVGTLGDPRVLASPLDLAAAFGSDFALAIQDEAGAHSQGRTIPSRWPPCARPWRRVPRKPGVGPCTTPGCPRSSRCGCHAARPSPTSCAATPGRPSPSRLVSLPTPSSSTTPSSTPSRPSVIPVADPRHPASGTGSNRTRCPSSDSRPWLR